VFHDKEITYSFCIPEKDVPKDIMQSYDLICGAIIRGLRTIGIDAKFAPLNDIVVNGKKISGNAQTRRLGVVLQHGTILIDVDVDKMFSLLKVPDEKIKDKMIANVKERLTSLNKETGQNICYNDVAIALRKGFEEQFNAVFTESELMQEEIVLANFIKKEKFATEEWNNKRALS
jgi:lipoate-protein ligase A